MRNLFVVIILFLTTSAYSQKIGYTVTISRDRQLTTKHFNTQSITLVKKSILASTGLDINIKQIFQRNNLFFEYRTNGIYFYCEKKIVKRKKNGRRVYRKIKQKELSLLANNNATSPGNKIQP